MKPDIDARSLASSLGVALRIAQRLGLQDESTYAKLSVLDAELRRRLWWALIIFDNRMCEMSNNLKSTMLLPIWNCKTASNFNDFDLRAETKTMPKENEAPSQAVFTVVRTAMADQLRHTPWSLDFNNPLLKPLARRQQSTLDAFEQQLEARYLSKCNPEDPLHFMTIWTARGLMAKNRFWEHLSKHPSSQDEAIRDEAVGYAIGYIECDTQLLSSPLTKRFEWYVKAYSFFPAYIHIIQDLRKRPLQKQADKAWSVMSVDWKARDRSTSRLELAGNPFFAMFSSIVILAWEARCEEVARLEQMPEPLPDIVQEMYDKIGPEKDPVGILGGGGNGFAGFGPPEQPPQMDIDDLLSTLMPMTADWTTQQPAFV